MTMVLCATPYKDPLPQCTATAESDCLGNKAIGEAAVLPIYMDIGIYINMCI
jgi:hypothetical protein